MPTRKYRNNDVNRQFVEIEVIGVDFFYMRRLKGSIGWTSTLVSSLSLLPIPPVWAIYAWRTHRTHGSRWPRRSWAACGPCWARETADKLRGVDGDVAPFLGRGERWLTARSRQQTEHHTHLERDARCRVTRIFLVVFLMFYFYSCVTTHKLEGSKKKTGRF